jgi:hypothetical protein
MSATFEDLDAVAPLLCDEDGGDKSCDIMEMEFPIREYLVPALIDFVVKELTAGAYKPEDDRNNAKDDLSSVSK